MRRSVDIVWRLVRIPTEHPRRLILPDCLRLKLPDCSEWFLLMEQAAEIDMSEQIMEEPLVLLG